MHKISGNTDSQDLILHVDLTTRKTWVEEMPAELQALYIGGIGANARLLYEKVKHTVDPLSADNVLILGQGPLVGTPFPTAGRTVAAAKSPMTNAYGHSGAIGRFGPLMRAAGFSHMIFYGQASSPVYILVRGMNQIEIREARDLWGLSIPQTVAALSARHPKCDTACIGPAGENRVRFACIMVSLDRTIARLGMGCVMGSKNLKAIVVQSTRKVPVADRGTLAALSKTYQKLFPKQMLSVALGYFGTPLVVGVRAAEGTLATRNFRDELPPDYRSLTEDKFLAFQNGRKGCWRCPVACHHSWKITEGKFAGIEGTKVEGGNIGPLGINLALFDYPAVLHLVNMINELGIESHELGLTISWAMECWEYGLLTAEDTDGMILKWGDHDVVAGLIRKISAREGFGDLLAEGARGAAKILGRGSEKYTWHVKGVSFPIWKKAGDTLGFCVSARGADHLFAYPFTAQGYDQSKRLAKRLFGAAGDAVGDPYSPEAKGRAIWWHENYKAIIDSLGLCLFPVVAVGISKDHEMIHPAALAKILAAVDGRPWNGTRLMECAERIIQVEKAFNVKCGLTRKDDYFVKKPPGRFYRPQEAVDLDHPGMLDEYYRYRGYSSDGLPTAARLRELGLNDVLEDLQRLDKVGEAEVPSLASIMAQQDVY
ncbi:MAG: aldehyde ferredoxin oxidoreductase family protein [Desulfobacterales bacterium]|nr:MAG: aldehyde ferredoxin oxidoreductase family protein [Desulfobacterales bacterium]